MARPFVKRPFLGKTFYLELKLYRNQEELAKDLKKLGGNVESFLSKDVTHVLTDRKEFSKRESLSSNGASRNNSSWSSNKTLNSPMNYFNSPGYSPANDYARGRSQIASRGLALVQKAKQNTRGTTDVLEVCAQWNIKVVHIDVVTSFIHQYKVEYTKYVRNHPEQQKEEKFKSDAIRVDYRNLNLPFIKVEDANQKYKPAYKEFKSLDGAIDSDLKAAFLGVIQDITSLHKPPDKEVTVNQHLRALKDVNADQSQRAFKDAKAGPSQKNSVNVKIHSAKTVDKPPFVAKQYISAVNIGCEKENVLQSQQNEKGKRPIPVSFQIPKDEPVKKQKKKYCEICQVSYVNIDTHLLTENHKKFQNNPNNFRQVKEILQTMPSLHIFLNKWKSPEVQLPVSRCIPFDECSAQFEDFVDLEDAELVAPQPIPQWQTVGNYFGEESIGTYHVCPAIISPLPYFPMLNAPYISCGKRDDISIFCEESNTFNVSPTLALPVLSVVRDAGYVNSNDCAIDLCTRVPEPAERAPVLSGSSTEIYEYGSEYFISASCSTGPSSSKLPFLEDSVEKLFSSRGTKAIEVSPVIENIKHFTSRECRIAV